MHDAAFQAHGWLLSSAQSSDVDRPGEAKAIERAEKLRAEARVAAVDDRTVSGRQPNIPSGSRGMG